MEQISSLTLFRPLQDCTETFISTMERRDSSLPSMEYAFQNDLQPDTALIDVILRWQSDAEGFQEMLSTPEIWMDIAAHSTPEMIRNGICAALSSNQASIVQHLLRVTILDDPYFCLFFAASHGRFEATLSYAVRFMAIQGNFLQTQMNCEYIQITTVPNFP